MVLQIRNVNLTGLRFRLIDAKEQVKWVCNHFAVTALKAFVTLLTYRALGPGCGSACVSDCADSPGEPPSRSDRGLCTL